jgi:signal transduction histidine kinase
LYKAQTAAHNQEAVIEITDTGCGIAETHLATIFKPFYTTKETGTGLGLAAVKNTVIAHEGFCTVKSVVGQGSVFTIHLPINL